MHNISDPEQLEKEKCKLVSDFQQNYPELYELYNYLLTLPIIAPPITYELIVWETGTNPEEK
jgi:hypothetical protein